MLRIPRTGYSFRGFTSWNCYVATGMMKSKSFASSTWNIFNFLTGTLETPKTRSSQVLFPHSPWPKISYWPTQLYRFTQSTPFLSPVNHHNPGDGAAWCRSMAFKRFKHSFLWSDPSLSRSEPPKVSDHLLPEAKFFECCWRWCWMVFQCFSWDPPKKVG